MTKLFQALLAASIAASFAASCTSHSRTIVANDTGAKLERFSIAAGRVPCEGVAPMQCLVVNGELFYDYIEGYVHEDGQAAEICVLRSQTPEPLAADQSAFIYRQTAC